MRMILKKTIQKLSDQDLKQLESLVRAEVRRRKQIALANAGWTSGEGLEAVLEASVKLNQPSVMFGIYLKEADGTREHCRSEEYPLTFTDYEQACKYKQSAIDETEHKFYVIREVHT